MVIVMVVMAGTEVVSVVDLMISVVEEILTTMFLPTVFIVGSMVSKIWNVGKRQKTTATFLLSENCASHLVPNGTAANYIILSTVQYHGI
jgi:hypothetical protein